MFTVMERRSQPESLQVNVHDLSVTVWKVRSPSENIKHSLYNGQD